MIQRVEAGQGALRSNMENLLAQRDARVAEMENKLERRNLPARRKSADF